ncbi:AAA family ATPase [Dictyobacter kobayashii]|nr:AAA family ATPase [Dictyobacter kobayashii]
MTTPSRSKKSTVAPSLWIRLCHQLWNGLRFFWIVIVLGLVINIISTRMTSDADFAPNTPVGWIGQHLSITIVAGAILVIITTVIFIIDHRNISASLLSPAKSGQAHFSFNQPLSDPGEFYGRVAARNTLITRLANKGSSSIIGERLIGKTWLLEYLQMVAPTYNPSYRVVKVSATHPECKSQAGFVRHVLAQFGISLSMNLSSVTPLEQLSKEIGDMRNFGVQPVLCIDEFECFRNKQEFDQDFFEGLRALAESNGLILVTASRHPLKEIIEGLTGQTSPFFNKVQQIALKPFTEQEARKFVEEKGDQVGFDKKEQEVLLQWSALYKVNGERYWLPLRLQLVGKLLLDDKQAQIAGLNVDDVRYQHDFKHRLDEEYQAVVKE